jgi:hypothetical protein
MMFRADVSAVTKAGLARRKAQGFRVGSVRYGYRLCEDRKRVEPHPHEQVVVELARGLRSTGATYRGICDILTRAGYVSRSGRPFQPSQVQRMCEGMTIGRRQRRLDPWQPLQDVS